MRRPQPPGLLRGRTAISPAPRPPPRPGPASEPRRQPAGASWRSPVRATPGGYLGLSGRISAVVAAIFEAPTPATAGQLSPAQPMTAGLRKAGRPKPRRLRLRLRAQDRILSRVLQGRGALLVVLPPLPLFCSALRLFTYFNLFIFIYLLIIHGQLTLEELAFKVAHRATSQKSTRNF